MLPHPWRDVRTRLLLIVVAALAIALAAGTAGFNLLLARSTSRNINAVLRQHVESELGTIQVRNGRIHITEAPDPVGDSRIWIYRGDQPLEAPSSGPEATAAARSLIGQPSRFLDVTGDLRLYSVPILDHGRRIGTLVAGVSVAPYEQTKRTAVIGSLTFAAALLAIVGVAVWWLLRSALRPVAQMTEQAAAWSEDELDRRFGLGEPHDELTRLAATLDALLDRIAASLRHERRFSAELSHELRTPLAKLIAEAELALRRERDVSEYRDALARVLRNAHQLTRTVETLIAAAQQSTGAVGIADATKVARAAVEGCSQLASERGVEVDLDAPPAGVRVGIDFDLAERILHPVVENACLYGRGHVRLSVERHDGRVLFTVDDDGPGVEDGEREDIFEPATRGRVGREAGAGAGLGLALARRLARAASGDVLAPPFGGGGRFVIRLPAA